MSNRIPAPCSVHSACPGCPRCGRRRSRAGCCSTRCSAAGLALPDGDVLAVTQKIVSKAEGRLRRLAEVSPSPRARRWRAETRKDPRIVELILQESRDIVRTRPGPHHRRASPRHRARQRRHRPLQRRRRRRRRAAAAGGSRRHGRATARRAAERPSGVRLGVMITDSVGRAWRKGTIGIAIGTAGVAPFRDLRGRARPDRPRAAGERDRAGGQPRRGRGAA